MVTSSFANNVSSLGITLVRIFTGWFILLYGLELFQIQALLEFLKESNIPFPYLTGYAAKIIEFIGGICLIFGLFTKWVTPLLIAVMCGVLYTVNNGNIFEGESPFLFMLLFTLFLINGAGKWSLDHLLITSRKEKKGNVNI